MAAKKSKNAGKLEVLGLLTAFEDALDDDERVSFISHPKSKRLREPLKDLKAIFHNREENRKWHEVHKAALELWQQLLSDAILSIDPGAKGYSELLKYLEAATDFEDVLYGLEPFYRDHTVHSLWVYLIGVKLMAEEGKLKEIADDLNWYVINDLRKKEYPDELVEWADLEERFLNKVIQKKRDAIWCIVALCHDLGYSLAKLPDLNRKVQAVLKHYEVPEFRHVGYTLDMEHQYLVTQFLELMAMEIRITPASDYSKAHSDGDGESVKKDRTRTKDLITCFAAVTEEIDGRLTARGDLNLRKLPNMRNLLMRAVSDQEKKKERKTDASGLDTLASKTYEDVLNKCFRDDSLYWRLCKALERKEHGILSAYLLYKTMGIFADTSVRSPAEIWGLEDDEAIDNIIRGDILFAIAQHEFAYAHINQMGSLAEILILCDELEEFSRLGRQLQSRSYNPTTAQTAIDITLLRAERRQHAPINTQVNIAMKYDYSSEQRLSDFAKFCWRKARRLCRLFSLGSSSLSKREETYLINKIEATFTYKDKETGRKSKNREIIFTVQQKKGPTVTIQLDGKSRVGLKCRDDEIFETRRPTNSLRDWLMHKDQFRIDPKDWPKDE